MHVQVTVLRELLAAVGAAEWSGGGVDSHVRVQSDVLGELLTAVLTGVRLITAVYFEMVHER